MCHADGAVIAEFGPTLTRLASNLNPLDVRSVSGAVSRKTAENFRGLAASAGGIAAPRPTTSIRAATNRRLIVVPPCGSLEIRREPCREWLLFEQPRGHSRLIRSAVQRGCLATPPLDECARVSSHRIVRRRDDDRRASNPAPQHSTEGSRLEPGAAVLDERHGGAGVRPVARVVDLSVPI